LVAWTAVAAGMNVCVLGVRVAAVVRLRRPVGIPLTHETSARLAAR
jgi:hypothetical protein